MNEVILNPYDEIVMKLLHYFITEKGYNPIVLHGAKDEIWLENLKENHQIIRIVTNYIHNDEQMNFDLFKVKQIVKNIRKQTFSRNMKTISIFLNLGDNVHFEDIKEDKNITCINALNMNEIYENSFIKTEFPDIGVTKDIKEEGFDLLIKVSEDIKVKNERESEKAEEVFKLKPPYITSLLIAANAFIFILMLVFGSWPIEVETLVRFGASNKGLIISGEYFRLITSIFLHAGAMHLIFNMYALYVLGPQLESFLGKGKFLTIYLFSGFLGNLLSMVLSPTDNIVSVGASGAIFGILGSLLYFGYHYRLYLNGVLRSQIIPIILLNITISFLPGIDTFAHLGGLMGGLLMTMALGVKYKSTKEEKINGWILTTIFTVFLIYLGFFK
jgi:rhomboid protease GluP